MRFNILIAEDEDDVRNLLKSIVGIFFLKEYPFLELDIKTVSNGQEALKIAKTQHLDLILTDIVMPIMDGLNFIKEVRNFDKNVPILVLSALSSKDSIDDIMQVGANNYTNKPLNHKLFMAQIKVFVDFYLRRQNRYNKKAINLFSKNIYKRKIEFFIDKEEDLFEFWEFVVDGIFDKYKIQKVLHLTYEIELAMIKKGFSNSIIIEEDDKNFYVTLLDADKLPYQDMMKFIEYEDISENEYKLDGYFLSLVIVKYDEDRKNSISIKKTDLNKDISKKELLSKLSNISTDDVESFLNDISFVSVDIYNLEEVSNINESKKIVKNILNYFREFNSTLLNFGVFKSLNLSFGKLISFLEKLDDEVLKDNEKRILLSKMLQGMVDDLEFFINGLFIEKTIKNIDFLDEKFEKSCKNIYTTFSS